MGTEADGSSDKDTAEKQDDKEEQAGGSAVDPETDAQVQFNVG